MPDKTLFDLAAQGKLRVLQRVSTIRTLLNLVLYCLGGRFPAASTILVFGSLTPRLLLGLFFGLRCVGLDEGGWFALELVQLSLQLSICRQQLCDLLLQTGYFSPQSSYFFL